MVASFILGAVSIDSGFSAQRFGRLTLLLLLAVVVACASYASANGWFRLHVRHQLDYEEGNVLNAAALITRGQTPYPDPHGWPVVTNPYGPVPYYVEAIPVAIGSVSFTGPRAVVWIACLLCGVFVGLITHKMSGSRIAAGIAGALFVSHSLVQYWMPVLRVDLLGLALTLGGVLVFVRWPRAWFVAVLLFTAAMFTKPTFVAAPLACFLLLVRRKEFRLVTKFAGSGIVLGLVELGAMQWSSHGAFWFYMVHTHPDPWRLSHYLQMFRYFVRGDPVLVVIGVASFAWALFRREFDVLTVYAICALLMTFSAGKLGSNDNHLLELTAVLCMFASVGLVTWSATARAWPAAGSVACVLLSVWLLLQLRYIPTAAPEPACNRAYDLVQQWPSDRVLSEDVGALVLAHKTVWVSNPFVYGQLTNSGRWSDEALSSRIRSHWFDLIVLSEDARMETDRWSPALRQEILKNYRLGAQFRCEGAKAAYVPNDATPDTRH